MFAIEITLNKNVRASAAGWFFTSMVSNSIMIRDVEAEAEAGSGPFSVEAEAEAKNLPLPLPHRLFDLKSNLAKKFCPFSNVD